MFLKNIIGIVRSLPLILSDTRDPADVSLNRVITLGAAVYLAAAPVLVLIFKPEFWPQMADLWKAALTFLGAQTAGNIYTKVIRFRHDVRSEKMGKARCNDGFNE